MARIRQTRYGVGYPTGNGIWDRRSNGWRVRFYLGKDPITNKKILSRGILVEVESPYTRSGKKLNDKAKAAAEELRISLVRDYEKNLQHGGCPPEKVSVLDLIDEWCDQRANDPTLQDGTKDRYSAPVRRSKLYFGHFMVSQIKVRMIRAIYKKALEEDGLSHSQVARMHNVMSMVFDEALADELVFSNPFRNKTIKVSPPSNNTRSSLTEDEAKELVSSTFKPSEESRFIAVLIGVETGLRKGEILGLQWKHVHLDDDPRIEVMQQLRKRTKSYKDPKANSFRIIHISEQLASILRTWKKKQARLMSETTKERSELRAKRNQKRHASSDGNATKIPEFPLLQAEETPVITDKLGEPVDPSNFHRWFTQFCCERGFGHMVDDNGNVHVQRYNEKGHPVDDQGRPYSRVNPRPKIKLHYEGLVFHELRHTSITLQLAHDIDLVTVMNRAGHKKLSTTSIYAHPVPVNDAKAAAIIGTVLDDNQYLDTAGDPDSPTERPLPDR